MKPSLSQKERSVLLMLGNKSPEEIQPFDTHIRGEIGRLSMEIDKGNREIASLKEDLTGSETKLVQDIGAFEATARTYLAYVGAENISPNPPAPVPAPVPMEVPPGPQEAPSEPEPEAGAPAPALVETPQEAPQEAPDGDDSPEPESD